MLLLHSRTSRDYIRTAFLVELQGNFRPEDVPLTCTITHRCDVKNGNGQVAIHKNDTSVFTIQGRIVPYTKDGNGGYYAFVPKNPLQPPQGLPALVLNIPIVLDFGWTDHVINTQTFNIPINPGWSGEIQVALGTGTHRIESRTIPFAERTWGLPAAYGSAISPLGPLQELVNIQGIPPELHESWVKIKKWLEGSAPRATYPVRANNGVKFYNDASEDAEGNKGAFHDLYNAMQGAQHFIFIADWSFHPNTHLKRPDHGPNIDDQIGRILIKKAQQNANIVIAIHTWNHVGPPVDDDPVNNAASETLNEMSKAIIPGAQRRPDNLLWRATERTTSPGIKSHHQKFVVLDTPVLRGGGRREMTVFFGGLDLTTGRFDWPDHPIDDQDDAFKQYDDWYNPEFADKKYSQDFLNLPRQPWHDIYAQLTGPTAWDFIFEFVGRWTAGAPGFQSRAALGGNRDQDQLVWKKFEALLNDNTFVHLFDRQPERLFSAQVYRSQEKSYWYTQDLQGIRSQIAPGFLQWGLHKPYEKSIHKAYLQAIQRAEKFIYIETQYLIAGECAREPKIEDPTQRRNHIPKAIVDRVKEKHAKGEDFHVYILLPMFPEGAPDAIQLRPVRYFQWQTINWMKDEVDNAISTNPKNKTWTDYLSFYFLGNRTHIPDANHANWTRRRDKIRAGHRYMIYVHSKMMIVDDTWIIIGSANLNERSMAGRTDSEICVGMWPAPGEEEFGLQAIGGFRKKLWDEHLGRGFCQSQPLNFPNFHADHPQRLDTYRAVQAAALANLNDFVNGTTNSNPSNSINHLMLWNLNDPKFATMLVPDSRNTNDEWLVQPTWRGIGMAIPNSGVL